MGISNEALKKIQAIRDSINKNEGNRSDPTKFQPLQLRPGEKKTWTFIILPGLEKGEPCVGGTASRDTGDGIFYVKAGTHYLKHKRTAVECPRIFNGDKCALCDLGFSLLREADDDNQKKDIRDKYLPREFAVINAYFPPNVGNPEDLEGKVFWFPVGQKKVRDKFFECINTDKEDALRNPNDPAAYGPFWPFPDFESEEPNVCYQFALKANKPHGNKYNDYGGSEFLPLSRAPLEKYLPAGKTVEDIMNLRYDLWKKYRDASAERTQEEVDEILRMLANAGVDDSDDHGSHSSGHVTSEASETPSETPASTPTTNEVSEPDDEPESEAADEEPRAEPQAEAAAAPASMSPDLQKMLQRLGKKS